MADARPADVLAHRIWRRSLQMARTGVLGARCTVSLNPVESRSVRCVSPLRLCGSDWPGRCGDLTDSYGAAKTSGPSSTSVTCTSNCALASSRMTRVMYGERSIRKGQASRASGVSGSSRSAVARQSAPSTVTVTGIPALPRQVERFAHHSGRAGPRIGPWTTASGVVRMKGPSPQPWCRARNVRDVTCPGGTDPPECTGERTGHGRRSDQFHRGEALQGLALQPQPPNARAPKPRPIHRR